MEKNHAALGTFSTNIEAEAIIRELQQSVSAMKKLSIVGKGYQTEEQMVGSYNSGDRAMDWRRHEAFWGGLWGMLFGSTLFVVGSALFVLPGIGPLLVFGPLFGWVVGILGGAIVIGGLSTLGAALLSTGIPKNSGLRHETALNSEK
ncbi:MAG: DUF1269 domain-containing protein [Desulfomicrobium sp.]|nr:DUF1269 domain-containing protein [Pseudomonadota bacterium]MBV1711420.1 DUF1269 domain-containing protein [Desulfomicrobium sp.]MBU4570822.1 DUF1269 domain-containing protein [Pseudomonadota bacterium]MBU4595312.1 DUF1269 domain-containing protein [Pseudomonadota bacterium]MBV1720744.1 DUF1269 domain-containing protein [Desulfomicrobium sp.]